MNDNKTTHHSARFILEIKKFDVQIGINKIVFSGIRGSL